MDGQNARCELRAARVRRGLARREKDAGGEWGRGTGSATHITVLDRGVCCLCHCILLARHCHLVLRVIRCRERVERSRSAHSLTDYGYLRPRRKHQSRHGHSAGVAGAARTLPPAGTAGRLKHRPSAQSSIRERGQREVRPRACITIRVTVAASHGHLCSTIRGETRSTRTPRYSLAMSRS